MALNNWPQAVHADLKILFSSIGQAVQVVVIGFPSVVMTLEED